MIKDFQLQDPELSSKLTILLNECYHQLSPMEINMMRFVFMRFKRYSDSEYHLYMVAVYALFFFHKVSLDYPLLTDQDRALLEQLRDTFMYEMKGEKEAYIRSMLELDDELLLLKILIKYTVLLAEEEYGEFIPHKDGYYRALGWLIPLLSYKNYEIIASFLQDVYFRKLYPEKYEWTKEANAVSIGTTEIMENYMVDITNDITMMMEKLQIFGIVKLRKKSLFSVYNKMLSKRSMDIHDFAGIRIIFRSLEDLIRFAGEIEQHFIVRIKKDYVREPKESGYQWIHYTLLYTYRTFETEMELQLRTEEMNTAINEQESLKHFSYSLRRNKWDPIFTEVYEGIDLIEKYTGMKVDE